MATICAPRIYKDGSRFRITEPVHSGGGSGTLSINGVPRTAVVFMTDSATPALTGNNTFTYANQLLNLQGNFVIDASYLIHDSEGRNYSRSFEFKANGYKHVTQAFDELTAYNVDVSLTIQLEKNLTGTTTETLPIILGDVVATGETMYVIRYKQIFNTNTYKQAIVESNHHGAFDDVSGAFLALNDTVFDTSGTFISPTFDYIANGTTSIHINYRIATGLTNIQYANFYYDIEMMTSKRISVTEWEMDLIFT